MSLFVPADSSGPAPLLVLLHGFAGQYDEFAAATGLLTEASEAGVALLVPSGAGDPPTWEVQAGPADDVGFIDALLTDAANDPCIDPTRVWLAGYSAGAGFAGRFACVGDRPLAGIVMNAAVFPASCDPGPLGVVVAHGTDDLVVPYTGLDIGTDDDPIVLPATPDLVAGWADRLGCDPDPREVIGVESANTRWTGCDDATVDLVTYIGGGHRWPGRPLVGGEGLVVESPDLTCIVLSAVTESADPVAACAP
ncbi:MAG: PHB depolymerase family esterase [Ilumatobacter sp.]|uniref:alpha/beta hydrolase family esterase n=1 Tax=Ilumatobacter sp. TaxID=1967498 RepID=UPI003298C42A